MTPPTKPPTVVYVIGTYPLVTTTFIDREIRLVRRRGVDVRVVSVRRPEPDAELSTDQRALQRGVDYLLPVRLATLLAAHLRFLARRPARYLATLARLVSRPHRTIRQRAKTVGHFALGVHAAQVASAHRADEVHAHFADRAATVGIVMSRLLDVPFSMSVHAGADIFVDPVLLPEKVRRARRVMTCTAHNKARLVELVGKELGRKIVVMPHGLELARYRPATGADRGDPVVLAVGQLTERKGLADLVRACAHLRDRGYLLQCRIVGRGPQHDDLRALVEALRADDTVELCGGLPHEQVIEQYRAATMFVLPCVRAGNGDVDGIPNVLAEAMAMAVPVVSTTLPAIRELVEHGENGLLVAPGDHVALADAIACLLDDAELRARIAARGRRSVEEMFDVEVNVARFAATLWPDVAHDTEEVRAR